MPKLSSWRDLLKDIMNDPVARDRLSGAVGVHPMTLNRWVNNESNPRPQNQRQLLSALPYEQRSRMAALLEGEYLDLSESSISGSLNQIEYSFVMQVLELRATTPDFVLFWALCNKVFQHALRRLDPERTGTCSSRAINGKEDTMTADSQTVRIKFHSSYTFLNVHVTLPN